MKAERIERWKRLEMKKKTVPAMIECISSNFVVGSLDPTRPAGCWSRSSQNARPALIYAIAGHDVLRLVADSL
eukprot:590488-Pleurochrysis_carterae.AAC.3